VLDVMPKKYCQDYEMSMAALLHDASEAYTGDILKPLKIMLPKFQDIEKRVTEVIFNKFDIDISLLEKIKPFDIKAQKIEYNFFYRKKNNLSYMLPEYAYHTFMHKYRMIKKIIKNEVYKNQ
jgi:5'-deoxynucleotidase YfbR-like HD superfamily hydrolase